MNIAGFKENVKHLDSIVSRASVEIEHHANKPLAARLRVAWVRVRAAIMKEWGMNKQAKNDYEQYILFWETHLDEMYEFTEGGIITHDGETEQGWWEAFLI